MGHIAYLRNIIPSNPEGTYDLNGMLIVAREGEKNGILFVLIFFK